MTVAHFTEILFIGFFTAAGLYSALLFLITRDRPFLWYAALMDATAAAQLVFAPDIFHFSLEANMLFRSVSFGAFFASQAAFAWTFLRLRARLPRFARAVIVVLVLNLLALAAQYFTAPAPAYLALDHILFIALLVACGAPAWNAAKTGNEDARYYLLAFGGAVLGVVASTLSQYLRLGAWPEYFFQFAVAWEGALLALALASGYARLDPLTGVKSRRAFEDRLAIDWKTARSSGTGLAVILIALYGLKEHEARFGRIAADAMLRRIANLCVGCCRDRADVFARYGDEAFAAIIPRVTRERADDIAIRMRDMVAAECLISIGVGVGSVDEANSAKGLVQRAAQRSARDAINRSMVSSA